MKEGWKYKPLREVCEVINGLWKGKKPPYAKVGVIRNTNFTKQLTLDFNNIEYIDVEVRQLMKRTLHKGDIIIEKSGGSEKWPVGRACVFYGGPDEKYSFSNFTSVLRVKDPVEMSYEFLHKYLYFIYFRGDTRSMQKAATGIHNIEFDKYLDIQIPIIPLSEQKVIVEKINKVIEKLGSVQANALASLNEAIFLFDTALNATFSNHSGWEEHRLDELCSIESRLVDPTAECFAKIPHIGGANITSTTGHLIDVKAVEDEDLSSGKYFFEENVVLYNKIRPYLKKVALPTTCGLCSADMYPLTPKKGTDREFLRFLLLTKHFTDYAISGSARAGMPKVNRKHLFAYSCYTPSLEKQKLIASNLRSLLANIEELQKNEDSILKECETLKQAVLKQVFEINN